MPDVVLDASALLAVAHREPGHDVVLPLLANAAISAVNLAEVVSKLMERGLEEGPIRSALAPFDFAVVPSDAQSAYQTGALRSETRHLGLSLGDRACLALARELDLPVYTADRSWSALSDPRVRLIR